MLSNATQSVYQMQKGGRKMGERGKGKVRLRSLREMLKRREQICRLHVATTVGPVPVATNQEL